MEHRDFFIVCIREQRVSTDHQMILEEIKGYGKRRNCKYFKGRTTWPIAAT